MGGETTPELGNFENPLFDALNNENDVIASAEAVAEEKTQELVKRYHDRFNPYVRGHGALERTIIDEDTGERYYDM